MHLITGQFNDSYRPVMDGVVNVIKNYTYWLDKKYGESYVVTLDYPNYVDDEEFEVIRYFSTTFPRRHPYRIGMPRIDMKFMKKINSIQFDIIHAHSPFSSGQLALYIARKREIPIVATFHSKYYDDILQVVKSEQIAQMVLKKVIGFYSKVDVVWTVNRSTVNTLRDYGFTGNVEVMANGTDFKPVFQTVEMFDMVEGRLNVAKDVPVLLFVGQHIWQKNLRTLINSLSLLKNMGKRFKMVFVGSGVAEDALKKMSEELNLDDHVTFLGQIQDREYLQAIFARADIFMLPSVYDNAPIVIKEAAAAGCPALVIENTNAAEDIEDGFNGFLVQNDPEKIAQKLYRILADTGKLENIGSNARNTLYRNWESIIDDVAKRYGEIIRAYGSGKTETQN